MSNLSEGVKGAVQTKMYDDYLTPPSAMDETAVWNEVMVWEIVDTALTAYESETVEPLREELEQAKDALNNWGLGFCEDCHGPLTMCGRCDPSDGSPTEGCEVCILKEKIESAERHLKSSVDREDVLAKENARLREVIRKLQLLVLDHDTPPEGADHE